MVTHLNTIQLDSTTENFKAVYIRAYRDYFVRIGMKFPDVVAAQFVHETKYGTSEIFKENHNMFGMKCSGRKVQICEKNGHAAYKNCADSVFDYLLYQKRMLRLAEEQGRTPKTNEDYMALLEDLPHLRKHRYAEDPDYLKKLRVHLGLLYTTG